MTKLRLLLRGLLFYWRTHLAVLFGVAAGAAVIGGALVVGDSMRASLRQMSLDRLGDVDFALSGGRFVTEDLAERIASSDGLTEAKVAPALSMSAGLTYQVEETVNRAGGVNVFGVDKRLWSMLKTGDVPGPEAGGVVLNNRVAETLGVAVGDEVSLNIEVPSAIPRESLLGERNDLTRELPLTVSAILEDELGASRFGLNPSQQIPAVAYVQLDELQGPLDLAETRPTRRNPVAKPARVNSLYVSEDNEGTDPLRTTEALSEMLREKLTLADLGLQIVPVEEEGYLSLESQRMILDEATSEAAKRAAFAFSARTETARTPITRSPTPEGEGNETGRPTTGRERLPTSPVYVYLVNELDNPSSQQHYAMYSVVAGIDFETVTTEPFAPFEFIDGGPPTSANEIVLNEFVANEQLNVAVGDEIVMKYYAVGSHGELPEEVKRFRVSGIVKLEGTAAEDRNLTPTLEGITDAETFNDWEQPFEMNLDRITSEDEDYWDKYRATPKAFLSLNVAQELFRSRFGSLTSFRVAIPEGMSADEFAKEYEREFLGAIDLGPLGLAFQPVKFQGLQAAAGTTDFTGLFIGFSFFLILSAAILIGLLFRLGVEQRSTSIGLIEAIGFTPGRTRQLYLGEGLLVVVLGAAIGTLGAIAYAGLMIHGLTTWWRGAIGTRFLFLAFTPTSLAIGFFSAVIVALIAIWWGFRRLNKVSLRALLAGATETTGQSKSGRAAIGAGIAVVLLVTALVLVGGGLLDLIPGTEAFGGFSWQVISFFVAGMLLLAAALVGLSAWLQRTRASAMRTATSLGFRNAERQRSRSVSTVGLIASATFVLVAVAASRRDPSAEAPKKDSGNGGFLLVAESTTPLPFAIDEPSGREKLGMQVELGSNNAQLLDEVETVSFRVRPGDDASCLNLYRTGLPRILGVPQRMIDRGGFRFTSTAGENPWTLLREQVPATEIRVPKEGKIRKVTAIPTVPVLGDANTLMYSLKKGIDDVILVPNEENPEYALKIAGMLDGSVFQGVLLMSEENFLALYPEQEGYGYFLIEGPVGEQNELSNLLETELTPYGFDAEPVADRIADFLAVQNTYLSTFQALGGLGLLLGTIGLGTVMLRNVIERRSELALLRAVGFQNGKLARLVLIENAFLLGWGLIAGTVAALLAVSPHLASRGADVPVTSGVLMLVAVAVVGMLSALFAVRAAVRTPIVSTLRGE